MDRSMSTPLQADTLLTQPRFLSLLSNLLHVAATAISFFLTYYFVNFLQFSVLQAGFLISFYGVGILVALMVAPHLQHSKIILSALVLSTFALSNFLIVSSFLPLAFNLILLGFANALFKNAPLPSSLSSSQKINLYKSSSFGLSLAMLSIVFFSVNDFKILCITAFILNVFALFLMTVQILWVNPSILKQHSAPPFYKLTPSLLLLFLGGLLLAQLITTYGLYLARQFPHLGLSTLAIFMLIHLSILCFLQKPLLMVFHRGDTLFKGGCGALLLGLGCYVLNLGNVFSVVVLSAMVYSLGEVFFISALHKACHQTGTFNLFSKTLALSLILGASLSTYVYQYFGAHTLWQACAIVGALSFAVGLKGLKTTTVLSS